MGTTDAADLDATPTADTQFRMGSITKTFTAVLVMQCRDDGLLDLDDRLDQHLPGTPHGSLTIRRMLAHRSGLQREPVGDDLGAAGGAAARRAACRSRRGGGRAAAGQPPPLLQPRLRAARRGGRPRLRREPWEDALRTRVLEPLGMRRTTPRRTPPYANGYFTDPYADRLLAEPEFPGNAFAPAAELWSTVDDLTRWAAFIAEPDAAVLSPDTVEEMCHPQVMYDLDSWRLAWGLGFMLHRRGERVLVGHDGAMPGFLAGLAVRRKEKVGAVVLANTSAAADPGGLAVDLVLRTVDDDPDPATPWRPGPAVPPPVEELLGLWWSEGTAYAFSAREGRLEIKAVDAPRSAEPSVLVEEGADRFRVVSGRAQGELLRVVRRDDGTVERLYWATYPVTRDPRPFGA